jgi:prepilin-type N-terminal cleavage/methylation domain-containing protein
MQLMTSRRSAVVEATKAPHRPGVGPRLAAFTLIELLTVIAIIGLLAGLIIGGAGLAKVKGAEARIRGELERLVTAIEDFKAKYGFYPPDNVASRTPFIIVNPVTNQLYYELTGTIYSREANEFQTARGRETIPVALIKQFFGTDGFVNSVKSSGNPVQDAKQVKDFLGTLKPDQKQAVNPAGNALVLVVPSPWPRGRTDHPVPDKPALNPWRYVSTNPTNNPGSFDLWAEYVLGGQVKIISNWRKDPFPKE